MTDKLIDQIVYKLYGLTDDEIAIVEGQSRDAMSPIGLEVLQTIPPVEREGVRAIAFKVSNLGEAKEEMKKKGVRHIKDIKIGGFREAVFHPDDVHGIRLCLYQYQAPTIVDAYLEK